MHKVLCLALVTFFAPYIFAQPLEDRCRVYVVSHKDFQNDVPSGKKEEDGSIIPKGVRVLGRFKAKVAEEEATSAEYELAEERLKIVATVFYTDDSLRTKLTWNSVIVSLSVLDKTKEASQSFLNHSSAEFSYLPFHKVRTSAIILLKGQVHTITAECETFSGKDGDEAVKEIAKGFCTEQKENTSKQTYLPKAKTTLKRKR